MTERRCVWLSEDQRWRLLCAASRLFDSDLTTVLDIVEAYDAAPSDPVEAVRECLGKLIRPKYVVGPYTESVLKALGWEKP